MVGSAPAFLTQSPGLAHLGTEHARGRWQRQDPTVRILKKPTCSAMQPV